MRDQALAGAVAAFAIGCLMSVLVASTGALSGSMPAILALTLPLLLGGVLYGWLLDTGRMRAGFGPGILFWIVAFPLARFAQELLVGTDDSGLADGLGPFFLYQALVGGAFGLGFFLLHAQIWGVMSRREESG